MIEITDEELYELSAKWVKAQGYIESLSSESLLLIKQKIDEEIKRRSLKD